jgi:hypothetical protein
VRLRSRECPRCVPPNSCICLFASSCFQLAHIGSRQPRIRKRQLFGLHVRIATRAARWRNNLQPAAAGRRYLHVLIQAARRTDYSLGLRELVALGHRSSALPHRRSAAADIGQTCDVPLLRRPLIDRLCERRAGNRYTRDNEHDGAAHPAICLIMTVEVPSTTLSVPPGLNRRQPAPVPSIGAPQHQVPEMGTDCGSALSRW